MTLTRERRLRKRLRAAIKYHRIESSKLQEAGSMAASRWEDGYIAALYWVQDRLDKMKE